MSHMDVSDIFHDRRDLPQPEPESVEQDPEMVNGTESAPRMSPEAIIDALRFPSAGDDGGMIQMRRRDQDLCRVCLEPMLSHGAGCEHHVPERLPHGMRTPGVSADVEDGRTASTQRSGIRLTPRRDLD